MNILVFGAGMQGTLYGVRLARSGHDVTLVARGARARHLLAQGAVVENVLTGRRDRVRLPVIEALDQNSAAALCLVAVRRDQLDDALLSLRLAPGIRRFLFLVNHAAGSESLFAALGRDRVVLGFPGAAGSIEDGVDRYVEVAEQPTVVETSAAEIGDILRSAGFRTLLVADMDAWLKRHAVFVTAVSGAIYLAGGTANALAAQGRLVRTIVVAVREGWRALDVRGVAPPPLALRAIICWVPTPLAVLYWRRLLASPRGEFYFARHAHHAAREMAALAADVRAFADARQAPNLFRLLDAIDRAVAGA